MIIIIIVLTITTTITIIFKIGNNDIHNDINTMYTKCHNNNTHIRGTIVISNAPKGNGIGATGS